MLREGSFVHIKSLILNAIGDRLNAVGILYSRAVNFVVDLNTDIVYTETDTLSTSYALSTLWLAAGCAQC